MRDDSAEYQELLNSLAPTDLIGYGPAHYRVAKVLATDFERLEPKKQPCPHLQHQEGNAAVANVPEGDPLEPTVRETRGVIYANLERWQEASADLEIAAQIENGNEQLEYLRARVLAELSAGDPS